MRYALRRFPYPLSRPRSIMEPTRTIKAEAHQLVDELPEGATWDDLMERIYVRQAIDAGWADSEAGRTTDVKEVRARFGLEP